MPLGVEPVNVPLIQAAERRTERDILLYCNFHLGHKYRHRENIRPDLWRQFAHQPWVTADPWRPDRAADYIAQLGRSCFVLSPPGYAWDCYRTYEAIAMGAIPIVKRHPPITNHLEALPALLVNDWSDVTEDRLRNYWAPAKGIDSITMSCWRWRIHEAAAECRQGVMA